MSIGGPGATFWMILAGFLGMSSKFAECTLGQIYRETRSDGHILGGPVQYLSRGFAEVGWTRFGKFLVPTSCRSCLDPVCMIRCPVASIHRGDNREIVIEDWCIGCSACAESCPYGSIQMYDLGIIPEKARGWRYLPSSHPLARGDWFRPRRRRRAPMNRSRRARRSSRWSTS